MKQSKEIYEEYEENLEEIVSTEDMAALAEFRKNIAGEYDLLNRDDVVAVDAFLDRITETFGEMRHFDHQQKAYIRDILAEDIQMRDNAHNTPVKSHPESKRNDMKEVVQPNVESATVNYMKFVQPFENTRLYNDELERYKKHQKSYLAEDLGIMNPRDLGDAMDVLLDIVRKKVQKRAPIHRERAEIVDIQKRLAHAWVKRLYEPYVQSTKNDTIADFWRMAESGMRETKGLEGQDVEKMIAVVRRGLEHVVAQKQIDAKQPMRVGAEKPKTPDIAVLKEKMEKAFFTLSQKKDAFRKSHAVMKQMGMQRDFRKEWDDTISVFETEYNAAHKAYMDALRERGEGRVKEIIQTCDAMDEATGQIAEKHGSAHIVKKVSAWFGGLRAHAKRAATRAFVVAGLVVTLSGTVGQDRVVDTYNGATLQQKEAFVQKKDNDADSSLLAQLETPVDSLGRELPTVEHSGDDDMAVHDDQIARDNEGEHAEARDAVVVEVRDGDTLWDIIARQLEDEAEYRTLDGAQKLIVIDTLKDHFVHMSSAQLQEIGFESGDVGHIYKGNTLDLTSIMGDKARIAASIAKGRVFRKEDV